MDKTRPAVAPIVERVAGWSARHRIIVVVGWLALVVATFTLGQRVGTGNINSYDPARQARPNGYSRGPTWPSRTRKAS
jgi:RND superfamily putative drug exporter